jgi:hypothetical protein
MKQPEVGDYVRYFTYRGNDAGPCTWGKVERVSDIMFAGTLVCSTYNGRKAGDEFTTRFVNIPGHCEIFPPDAEEVLVMLAKTALLGEMQ